MCAKQGKGGNVFAAKGKAIAAQEEQRRNKLAATSHPADTEVAKNQKAEKLVEVDPKKVDLAVPAASPGSAKGLQDGWTRFTVTTKVELVEALKVYAFRTRQSIKDVVTSAFQQYLEDKNVGSR